MENMTKHKLKYMINIYIYLRDVKNKKYLNCLRIYEVAY